MFIRLANIKLPNVSQTARIDRKSNLSCPGWNDAEIQGRVGCSVGWRHRHDGHVVVGWDDRHLATFYANIWSEHWRHKKSPNDESPTVGKY